MACVSRTHTLTLTYAHTRNYRSCSSQVERAPPLFSRPSNCPGRAAYETMKEERLRLTSPKVRTTSPPPYLTGDAYGRMQHAAGATALPANHQRPPPDVSETCWLSGLTGSMRCPKPRSGPHRRSHYCWRAGMSTRALSLRCLRYLLRVPPVHPALPVCLPACLPLLALPALLPRSP
jgi:hypothetical protein